MTETAESLPDGLRHIAVIMDGNGRWAASRGLPRLMGHRRGVEALRGLVRSAISFDLPYLTVYSFSTENWRRPEGEVRGLMGLARRFVDSDLAELHKANVRIRIIGDRGLVVSRFARSRHKCGDENKRQYGPKLHGRL